MYQQLGSIQSVGTKAYDIAGRIQQIAEQARGAIAGAAAGAKGVQVKQSANPYTAPIVIGLLGLGIGLLIASARKR